MMANITVKSEGRRHYLIGDTYAIKDKLRNAGAKWDSDRRAWWTGKKEIAERFAGGSAATAETQSVEPPAPAERQGEKLADDSKIVGKATYKGKPYILVWEGETRRGSACKLAAHDGSLVFWAEASLVHVTKRYEEREVRGFYGRRGHTESMTFGKLKRLREKYARARAEGNEDGIANGQRYECEECGEYVVRGQGTCWETGATH